MMSRIDSQHWKISTARHFQNGRHNTPKIQHCPISSKFDMWVDIKDLTPVRGQDGRFLLVSNSAKPRWRPEIFPLGVWDFSVLPSYRCLILFLTNILLKVQYFPSWDTPYMKYDMTHILTSLKNDVKGTDQGHLEIRKNENKRHKDIQYGWILYLKKSNG